MIYFVRSLKTGNIKIGFSDDVHRRIGQLKHEHGELMLLGVIEGGRAFETALHMAFSGYRVAELGREWFSDNPKLRRYIAVYASKSVKPRRRILPRMVRPSYQPGKVNCHLYDLLMKKRQQDGYADYHIDALASDTGIPLLTLHRMLTNEATVYKDAHCDALLKFFGCGVNDFLSISLSDRFQTENS